MGTTKIYRVSMWNEDKLAWVPVRSAKAGARMTVYEDFDTAARAMAGFKGTRRRERKFRVESTELLGWSTYA